MSGATILQPRHPRPLRTTAHATGPLAPELLSQSARRLRVLTLLYAFTFFMAGFVPNLLLSEQRPMFFAKPENWAPGVVSIAMALAVYVFTSTRVPLSTVMNVGLVFEVVSCYGIAAAEYLDPSRLNLNGWMGLSWVAPWALLFSVVVPTRPLKAALVTLASVSSVPVVMGFMVLTERTTFSPGPLRFFFWIVFPYLLIA